LSVCWRRNKRKLSVCKGIKGTVPRDFLIYFFCINQLHLGTWFTGCKLFRIVSKFSEHFKF
jgi:hypothetical protein